MALGRVRARRLAGIHPVRDVPPVIGGGELFLMNLEAADSLDGRYFGPFPASAVILSLIHI